MTEKQHEELKNILRSEIRSEISDVLQPIKELLTKLSTTIWGANGDNGIVGNQKEMRTGMENMNTAIITMTEQVKQVRTTAIFWTRLLGGAALTGIIFIVVKLLTHS